MNSNSHHNQSHPPSAPSHSILPIYTNNTQNNNSLNKHWSIGQANSRLHAYGLQSALEKDIYRNALDDEKTQAIPMNDLRMSESNTVYSNTNPFLPGETMVQKPTRSPTHRSLRHKTYGFQDPFANAPMEAWQEIKDYNLRVNGLPTLDQMMRLHTYSPLTQSNFTSFLRRRNVHQNLNFLMELDTHEKLWKAYLQSIDRQNRQRLSRFLESAAEKDQQQQRVNNPLAPMVSSTSYIETPDTDDLLTPLPPQPLTPRSFTESEAYASRVTLGEKPLSRHSLVQNATRIYRTYCASALDAARPIHLPDDHRKALGDLIEKNERPEPIVFDSARTHVFEILNVFYYPIFIDEVLHKNISVTSSRFLLGIGIIILILAFSIELSLIFLNSGQTATRWYSLIPFFVGWSCLIASITEFAWWFGISNINEIHFLVYSEIQDVTVKRIHRKRGFVWAFGILLLSIITTLIFVFIPPNRL